MVAVAAPAVSVNFRVNAPPVTQGSMRTFHRWKADGGCLVSLTSDNGPKLKEWRALVATQAKRAMRDRLPFEGPVRVDVLFLFERPKSHKMLDRTIQWPAVRGRNDIEKLVRAIHDAMTDAAVWWDDAQVAVLMAEKRYCDGLDQPGASISVRRLQP